MWMGLWIVGAAGRQSLVEAVDNHGAPPQDQTLGRQLSLYMGQKTLVWIHAGADGFGPESRFG